MVARYLVSPTARRGHRNITSVLHAAATSRRPVVVEIEPGLYRETLVVRGNVELIGLGDPGSVVVSQAHGSVVDACGAVRLVGLTVIGGDGDAVLCSGGTLTVKHSHIQGHGAVSVHASAGASVTLRESAIVSGRTLFTGSTGLVERCWFTGAPDNALAVIEGAVVRIRDCQVANSRIHGIRVSGARAWITGCSLTGVGNDAIIADARADITVTGCQITEVHRGGVSFIEQSQGLVEDTQVTDAEHGITVVTGADPIVRRCRFTGCRDTGINVHSQGRGRFENCEVVHAGNVGVFSTTGGAPDVSDCRVSDGNVGIAIDNARGRFTGIEIRDLTSVAIRLLDGATANFSDVEVERCQTGLEALGGGGTKAELVDTRFRDFSMAAVTVSGQSRITLRNVVAGRGSLGGFCVGDKGRLLMFHCRVEDTDVCGVVAYGEATLSAKNLTVTGSHEVGLSGHGLAYVEVTNSEFAGATVGGVSLLDTCSGRLADCSITGTQGVAVLHNGLVHLSGLRTSLPIKRVAAPADALKATINNFSGPVFNAAVEGVQLAWNNAIVSQQQAAEPSYDVGSEAPG